MDERKRNRIAALAILVFGALVFGIGINWGLPSHDVDRFLFGDDPSRQQNASDRSGAGVEHLAGDWNDTNTASDVAGHPINDRSEPVTLLNNQQGSTADELIQQGDSTLAALVKARNDLLAKQGQINSLTEKDQTQALNAGRAVQHRVDEDNAGRFDALRKTIQSDRVNRAIILRRFRLYSHQPDEMITFRALAVMHPSLMQFDPKLYQYGGLWIYPIGAILKAASLVNAVTLTSDPSFYIDSPEAFGKFYIIARAYSALWGLVGALTFMALVRHITRDQVLPLIGALGFISLPVIVDLAHEAKPHLAGVSLLLLATLAATHYVRTGRWKWIVWTAIACGAAAGMVLSGVAGLVILPIMGLCRRDHLGKIVQICIVGWLIAGAVYFATNPYVAIHLLRPDHRQILTSNFANTRAMYPVGSLSRGIVDSLRFIAIGASWPVAFAGFFGAIALIFPTCRKSKPIDPTSPANASRPMTGSGWLMSSVAILILIQFVMHAANKPAEYARFAAFIDVALLLAAFVSISRLFQHPASRAIAAIILFAATSIYAFPYVSGFLRDSSNDNTRITTAEALDHRLKSAPPDSVPTLLLDADPAPYNLPPVDLNRWRIVLNGMNRPAILNGLSFYVRPNMAFNILEPATPISWANMPFIVNPSIPEQK